MSIIVKFMPNKVKKIIMINKIGKLGFVGYKKISTNIKIPLIETLSKYRIWFLGEEIKQ